MKTGFSWKGRRAGEAAIKKGWIKRWGAASPALVGQWLRPGSFVSVRFRWVQGGGTGKRAVSGWTLDKKRLRSYDRSPE